MKYFSTAIAAASIACAVLADQPQLDAPKQAVTAFNRSSSVIGMAVKDSTGKEVGRVQDLVFDLETQKVGYAVISLSSGSDSRIIPVPVIALKPNQDHLVLNMSPAVLAMATSISNDQWPAPDSFAVGAAAGSEKGQGSSSDAK